MKKAKTILMVSALLLTFIVTKQLNVMQDTQEIWKDISVIGYQVSNKGNVRNSNSGKVLKPWLINGYPIVDLKGQNYPVHRLVAIHFKDNPENKPQVNHKDCDKTNNNDWNLEWATSSENAKHAVANGLFHPLLPGEDSYSAKLNNKQVLEIRELYPIVKSTRKLARQFNISRHAIICIVKRETWKHI